MLRSCQEACLDQLWRALQNASRRLRSRLKRCNTSSRNAPALLLLPVAPDLRQLSREPCKQTTLQADSNVPLVTPLRVGCREKCVSGSPQAHFSARVSDCCDSRQNKTHAFSKESKMSFSAYHKCPALMQLYL